VKIKSFLLCVIAGGGVIAAQTPVERAWSLFDTGLKDQSTDRRVKAVRALGLITNNDKSRHFAESALSDPKSDVRAAAAEALGQMKAKSSIPKLVEVLKSDKDTSVVFACGQALYDLGDSRGYDFYYAVLTGERKTGESLLDSQVKMLQDKKALAQMGLQAGLGFVPFGSLGYSVFKTATKDDASPVRAAAAIKLVRDSDSKTTDALMKVASDEKWVVRAGVLNAIAQRGDPALLKAVLPRLDDENETVRFTAAGTILRLTK
jgi:HEAT repeat protein